MPLCFFKLFSQKNDIDYIRMLNRKGDHDSVQIVASQLLKNHHLLTEDQFLTTSSLYLTALFNSNDYNPVLVAIDSISQIEPFNESPLVQTVLNIYKAPAQLSFYQFEECRKTYQQVIKNQQYLKSPYDSLLAKVHCNIAISYNWQGELDSANTYYNKSMIWYDKLLPSYKNYGGYNDFLGNYISFLNSSLILPREAQSIAEKALNYKHNRKLNLRNTYLYYAYFNAVIQYQDLDSIENFFLKFQDFYKRNDKADKTDLNSLLLKIAYTYMRHGNYRKSVTYYQNALKLSDTSRGYQNYSPDIHERLAFNYIRLKRPNLAIHHQKEMVIAAKENNEHDLYWRYMQAAQISGALKEIETCQSYIDSSLTSYKTYKYKNNINLINLYNLTAWSYHYIENHEQVIYYLQQLENICLSNPDKNRSSLSKTQTLLGRSLINNHQIDLAIKKLTGVIAHFESINKEVLSSNTQSGSHRFYLQAHFNLAKAYKQKFQMTQDIHYLEKASKHIEAARPYFDSRQQAASFDEDRIAIKNDDYQNFAPTGLYIFAKLANLTEDQSALDKALLYAQKSKAFALQQGVNDRAWKRQAGLPEELITQENNYLSHLARFQMDYENELLKERSDSARLNRLSQGINTYMAGLDSIEQIINSQYPDYKKARFEQVHPNLKAIQQKLGPQQVLLDYLLTDDQLFTMLWRSDTVNIHNQPIDSLFHQQLTAVLDQLSTPFYGTQSKQQILAFSQTLHTLYNVLIEPHETLIKNRHLIISPDKQLALLPFETLLTESTEGTPPDFRKFPWLLNRYPVSYTYNTALLPGNTNENIDVNRVIAFAPAYTGEGILSDSVLINLRKSLNGQLSPLPGAQKELQHINQIFRTTVFQDMDASKDEFLKHVDQDQLLHLAMHSLVDNAQPLNSQLVFSPSQDTTRVLKAYEIYNHSIKSPLLVLSSCNTGSGQLRTGEGIMSLARAFTFAGVQSQVMTLWPVNDQTGAELTTLFYSQIKQDKVKDVALQRAKQNYLKQVDAIQAHPYYWANYVLSGNTQPLAIKAPIGWQWMTGIIALSALLISLIVINKRKVN
jgi:CHAT domain-containing protein